MIAAVVVVIYGVALAFGLFRLDAWRINKAEEYLYKANNEQNISLKLQYSERAVLLRPSEEAYLLAGSAAVGLGEGQLAEKYLSNVKSSTGLLELGKAELELGKLSEAKASLASSYSLSRTEETGKLLYLVGGEGDYPDVSRETNPTNRTGLIYNALVTLGYPQAAIQTLENGTQGNNLGRDSLITLAEWEISQGSYQDAYSNLIRAKSADAYYPQVYQQLVLVCGKLGRSEEVSAYQAYLANISF